MLRVILDTCANITTRWVVDNDEPGVLTTALTIALSSRSYYEPRLTAIFLTQISSFFTHIHQHRLIAALL